MKTLVALTDDLDSDLKNSILTDNFKSNTSQIERRANESIPMETRLAEMAKYRAEYDEARRRVGIIQSRLADLTEKLEPLEFDCDRDQILLLQEKEQLLRELKFQISKATTKQQVEEFQGECKKLETDLRSALQLTNQTVTDRVKLHEQKETLVQQLKESLRAMAFLETQLKSMSASTLSISSSSSLGSMSSTSSKGSLSSGLSYTDIYGGIVATSSPTARVDMVALRKRIEKLLSADSDNSAPPTNTSSSLIATDSPIYENLPLTQPPQQRPPQPQPQQQQQLPPPPPYETSVPHLIGDNARRNLKDLKINISQEYLKRLQAGTSLSPLTDLLEKSRASRFSYESIESSLSPISETPSSPSFLLINSSSSNGSNTRSVSAAVSDESVAGDSGVFEASQKKPSNRNYRLVSDFETAQIRIKMRFDAVEQVLWVGIEKARHLGALLNALHETYEM